MFQKEITLEFLGGSFRQGFDTVKIREKRSIGALLFLFTGGTKVRNLKIPMKWDIIKLNDKNALNEQEGRCLSGIVFFETEKVENKAAK